MSSGAPCGACKFLRRKCVRVAYLRHTSGLSKVQQDLQQSIKYLVQAMWPNCCCTFPYLGGCDAVLTISYEAQARLSDPVYGCVATIFALQQQVAGLQAELAMVQAQLANRHAAVHLQQQQHISTLSTSPGPTSAYMQHIDHPQLSAISMSIPTGSGSAGPYSRVKEKGSTFQEMQNYDLGMPTNSLEPLSAASQHNILESLQKSRSGSMDQQDDGELQALAHSLLRRQ